MTSRPIYKCPPASDEHAIVPAESPDVPGCPIGQNRLNERGSDLNDTLNEQQLAAIEMLATGRSPTRVARQLEIDRRTLYRWRQDPAFSAALGRRRRELWSDAVQRVRGMANASLDIIEQHLSDRYERIRFRAAQTVLNLASLKKHAADMDEIDELEDGGT
jgi:hypothetical protein